MPSDGVNCVPSRYLRMTSLRPHHGTQRAVPFTLVEVLLAVMILAVGLGGVLAAYMKTADTLRIAREHVEAHGLLAGKMGEAQLAYTMHGALSATARRGTFGEPVEFTWDIAASDGPVKTLDEVTVTLTSRRTGRAYTLTTYFENNEQEAPPR